MGRRNVECEHGGQLRERVLSSRALNRALLARQLLLERYRDVVFNTRTPLSLPTFLVDGAVAGSWSYQNGRIRLEPFEPLPRAIRRELEDEGRGLAAFHAG
jgi:hypothetical protein